MFLKIKNNIFVLLIICMVFSFVNLEAKSQKLRGKAKVSFRSAQLYLREEVYEKALEQYLIVIEEEPNHVESLKNVADLNFLFSEQDSLKQKAYMETAHGYYQKAIDSILSISDWEKYDNFETILNDSQLKMKSIWVRIFKIGQEYYTESELDKAKVIFNELLELAPDSVQSYQMLAAIADKEGDAEKSMEYSMKIIESDPENTQILINLAIGFEEIENWAKAEEFYLKFVEAEPNNPNGYMSVAYVNTKLENNEKALEYYEKAIKIDPQNVTAIANAANISQILRNDEKAMTLLKQLVELENDAINYEILVPILVRNQKWEEVITYGKRWYELNPQSSLSIDFIIYAAGQTKNQEVLSKFQKIKENLK